jgi:MarR family transcriptional regulator, transcriptional regulator for hemolysin
MRPIQDIPTMTNEVARLLRRNFNHRAQPLGLTQVQWRALARLARNEGMRQVDLAESLELQPMTVARLIDRMETAGWVQRRRDPRDRRAVQLHLTPKAEPMIDQIRALAAETRGDAFAGLTPAALDAFYDTLHRIKENLLRAETGAAEALAARKEKQAAHG